MTANTTYWCEERLVITVDGPEGRRVVEVDRPFARVGSHRLSEVVLDDEAIAPRQLYFHATPRGVFCVDLAGNESDASPLDGWTHAGEYFVVGPYRISAQLAGKAAVPAQRLPGLNAKGTVAPPAPVLVMSVKGEDLARRELARQLTVFGRRRPSTLRVTSHSVSASHCVLYWESGVLWVVDLLSGNGTRLGGRRVEACRLPPGETVRAGRVELSLMAPRQVDGDGPDEITYDDRPIEERAEDQNDDSRNAERHPTGRGRHEFPREIAESLALAARLASQREDLETERTAWDEWRQETEAQLARRSRELDARQAEFEERKEDWESERQRTADESAARTATRDVGAERLAAERADFDAERTAWDDRRQQTEAELARRSRELAARQAEFEGRTEDGESERQRTADELAARSAALHATAARLAAERADFDAARREFDGIRQQFADQEAEREGRLSVPGGPRADAATVQPRATQEMIRLGPRWSPPIRPVDAWGMRPWYAALGFWAAIVAVASILSASIGAVCWLALLPAQTVVATVQATDHPAPSVGLSGFLGENEDQLRLARPQDVLRASRVLAAVILRPDVRSLGTMESSADAFAWLRKELMVGSADVGGRTRIGLRGKNAEELKILVDAIAQECVSQVADLRRAQLERWDQVLEAFRERTEGEIANQEAALDQLAEQGPSVDVELLPQKQQANLKQLEEAQSKLARLRAQRSTTEIELAGNPAVLDGDNTVDVSSTELNARLRSDPVAGPLQAELAEMVRARSEVEAAATGSTAAGREEEHRQEIEATARKLVARREEVRKELLAERQNRSEAEGTEDRDEIEDWPTRERQLQEEIDRRIEEAGRLRRIRDLQAALAGLRESLAAATREQEDIRARLASPVALCAIRQPAAVEQVDTTYRLPITVVAAACGFLVPLLLAVGWSGRQRRERPVARLLREYA